MTAPLEIRSRRQAVEYRASGDGVGVLAGYAIVYNSLSQNLGGFVERIDPGSVTKCLADNQLVMARYNHDDNFLLGTTAAGTLGLASDGTGLRYEVQLPNTSAGRDVAELARRGDLTHSSFAFRVAEQGDEWGVTDAGFPLRTVTAIAQLVDVAPVNSPAYMESTAGMRSLAARTGLSTDELAAAGTDEVRRLLIEPVKLQHLGGPVEIDRRLAVARMMQLELLRHTL